MGEVAWVGRGSLGRDDGRIALVRPGREAAPAARRPRRRRPPRRSPPRARSASTSAGAGASFYRELFTAAGGGSDREVLDALWDLVWAGEVTNDTFAPLRALRWKRPARDVRRRPGRLTSLGPPEAAGRWSLVEDAVGDADRAAPRDGARAARPARGRDPRGGRGRGRRGRLLGGLPGPAGARGGRPDPARLLRRRARARPSSRWPARSSGCARSANRPARRASARPGSSPPPTRPTRTAPRCPGRVAARTTAGRSSARPARTSSLVDGVAALYLERGGGTIQTLPAADDPEIADAALRRSARSSPTASPRAGHHEGRRRPVGESPFRERLVAAGLQRRATAGCVLRAGR